MPSIVERAQDTMFARLDSNHDGRLDVRFEGGRSVLVDDPPSSPPALERLGCGEFDRFWDTH